MGMFGPSCPLGRTWGYEVNSRIDGSSSAPMLNSGHGHAIFMWLELRSSLIPLHGHFWVCLAETTGLVYRFGKISTHGF